MGGIVVGDIGTKANDLITEADPGLAPREGWVVVRAHGEFLKVAGIEARLALEGKAAGKVQRPTDVLSVHFRHEICPREQNRGCAGGLVPVPAREAEAAGANAARIEDFEGAVALVSAIAILGGINL